MITRLCVHYVVSCCRQQPGGYETVLEDLGMTSDTFERRVAANFEPFKVRFKKSSRQNANIIGVDGTSKQTRLAHTKTYPIAKSVPRLYIHPH